MSHYSPLRYPGGKAKLSDFVQFLIKEKCNDTINTYIEPFSGGAGIALDLLFNGVAENIILNDYDKAIYSFWRAAIFETQKFVDEIDNVTVDIDEWHKQKEIYLNSRNRYSFELGFATFFLNRTNRSGILSAGPIGGYNQDGNYLIDVRFNKESLKNKINRIASKKKHIKIYNKDIRNFINLILPAYQNNSFVYFDPPYYFKGKELYQNYLLPKDHLSIYYSITQYVEAPWLITYDNVLPIYNMYSNFTCKQYNLNYSLANKGKSSELMVFSDEKMCPTIDELNMRKINIQLY